MKTILTTGAGSGGSNNLIRSIRHNSYPIRIIGTNADKFTLSRSMADRNYFIPRGEAGDAYFDAINEIIEREKVVLLVPNNDTEVRIMASNRERLGASVFLPEKDTVRICQDKMIFSEKMAAGGFKTGGNGLDRQHGGCGSGIRAFQRAREIMVPDAEGFWFRRGAARFEI